MRGGDGSSYFADLEEPIAIRQELALSLSSDFSGASSPHGVRASLLVADFLLDVRAALASWRTAMLRREATKAGLKPVRAGLVPSEGR